MIVTNESYREVICSRDAVPDEKITTVRNGPDLGRIYAVPADDRLRKRASTVLGYVGTLGYQDGLDYLLRALDVLVHDLGARDVRCYVMGVARRYPTCAARRKSSGSTTSSSSRAGWRTTICAVTFRRSISASSRIRRTPTTTARR